MGGPSRNLLAAVNPPSLGPETRKGLLKLERKMTNRHHINVRLLEGKFMCRSSGEGFAPDYANVKGASLLRLARGEHDLQVVLELGAGVAPGRTGARRRARPPCRPYQYKTVDMSHHR